MSADAAGTGEMTLAFSLSAIERVDDPARVFEDAREWSRYVGVVDNDGDRIAEVIAEHDLRQDFDPSDRDKWLALEEIRETTRTPRHVYVGASVEDRRVADHLGWEFVPVTEAAEKAGWALVGEKPDDGIVARLRRLLPNGLLPGRSG